MREVLRIARMFWSLEFVAVATIVLAAFAGMTGFWFVVLSVLKCRI